jgi:hypothetical protein
MIRDTVYFYNRRRGGRLVMNKKHFLPARPELVEGQDKYAAMVRQAHHERLLSDLGRGEEFVDIFLFPYIY